MSESKFGCIVYEDVFSRLDKRFDDQALGRIMRAAFTYGFFGVMPELKDPTEDYACADLMSVFDRNREAYDNRSRDGKINAAIKHAKSIEDLDERLSGIDGITNHDLFEIHRRYKDLHDK